jgi:mRNA-degrading endonuclease RelE of RelBE toxin-antitoxin system
MAISYTLLETDTFHNQFHALPKDVQTEMSADIVKLKSNPYAEPFCKALIGEFEGVWRIHVGRINNILYCVAYVGCEDCENRNLGNKIGCLDCYKYFWFHVKLVLCGRRDEFYYDLRSCWQSWILTATLIDQQE